MMLNVLFDFAVDFFCGQTVLNVFARVKIRECRES